MSSTTDTKQLRERLRDKLSPRNLRVLQHTFEGNTKPAEYYFGQSTSSPKNTFQLITALSENHPEASLDFLSRRKNEFSPGDIETNTTIDYIVNSFGLDRELVTRTAEDFTSLLALIYLLTYDPEEEQLSKHYESLIALATIFKANNEQIYYYDETLPLNEIERNVKSYIRHVNGDNERPHTVRTYGSDDAVILKIFAETSQTYQSVFQCRKDGTTPPLTPKITHEPRYNVKTIRVKAENIDDRGKITLSKSINRWRQDLQTLFEHVFAISGGVEALTQKELGGTTQVLDTAIASAESKDSDESDVTKSIQEEVLALQERALERMESNETEEDKLDRARARYREIEFVGVRVQSDEDTHMAEFVLRSSDEFEDVTDEVDDMDASITALLAKANPKNVRLIFRTTDIDGKTQEEFEVGRGQWTARGRGVPEEAIEMLDELFSGESETNE